MSEVKPPTSASLRGQEAEDVAREVGRILSSHMEHGAVAGHEHGKILGCLPMAMVEVADYFRTGILARLVREGQIRCLEAAATEVCAYCGMGVPRLSERDRCPAEPLHARIAALKGEG